MGLLDLERKGLEIAGEFRTFSDLLKELDGQDISFSVSKVENEIKED